MKKTTQSGVTTITKVARNPVVVAIIAADKAAGTAFAACGKVADLLMSEHNDGAKPGDEYKRLTALAKKLVDDSGVVVTHRNVWQAIGEALLIRLAPETDVITGESGSGPKKTTTHKAASECKSVREVRAAAKQIRSDIGLSDARANNAPPKKEAEPVDVKKFIREHQAEVLAALRAMGFNVEKTKAVAKPKPTAKPKADAKPKFKLATAQALEALVAAHA